MTTPEQEARNMLERMGWERAQTLTSKEIAELTNLIASVRALGTLASPLWAPGDLEC